jgi:tRNA modification GTPase
MRPASDTIVAVSSAPGRSLRGLVRVSGPRTLVIINRLLTGDPPPPRRLVACRVRLDENLSCPALLALFAGPASYTGDDLAEIQLPGNPALLDRVVRRFVELGARLAEPGEFTFRAFLAGKLDLTQVEGVAATIAATSDGQLEAAAMLRDGRLGNLARQLADRLADDLALVEAGIDFTDQEDVVPIAPDALWQHVQALRHQLDHLLSHSRSWGALEALPRVVLVGQPSTGKSTLFNALLARRRAVVSSTPGTTRDVLVEPLMLRQSGGQSVEVMLVDIAGLDTPRGALDHAAQDAARRAIRQADLVLTISDDNAPAEVHHDHVLHVRSKADLIGEPGQVSGFDVMVSAATGQGLDELRHQIAARLGNRGVSVTGQMLALQPRHETALRSAAGPLAHAAALLDPQRHSRAIEQVELVAGALRAALDDLAALAGRLTPDDVLGRIFATFCIGK